MKIATRLIVAALAVEFASCTNPSLVGCRRRALQLVVDRDAYADRRLVPVVVDHALSVAAERLDVSAQQTEQPGRHPCGLYSPLAGPRIAAAHQREAIASPLVDRREAAVAVVVGDVGIIVLGLIFLEAMPDTRQQGEVLALDAECRDGTGSSCARARRSARSTGG